MNLFTKLTCDYCGSELMPKTHRPAVLNGFRDGDTGQIVCSRCRGNHYRNKVTTKHRGKYTEYPLTIQMQKHP